MTTPLVRLADYARLGHAALAVSGQSLGLDGSGGLPGVAAPAPGEFMLEVTGRPASKKNSMKIVRFGKGPMAKHGLIQGERYRDWEKRALVELAAQWGGRPPITCQCRGTFVVRMDPAQRIDLYNAVAAMCDALQKAGVVVNDKLITSDGGSNIEVVRDGRPYIRAYLLPMQVGL